MLGKRLKKLRNERSMSLEQVANSIGKSASTVSRYENNQVSTLDYELIEKFAIALDTTPAYLLNMTDEYNYRPSIDTSKFINNDKVIMNILVVDEDMSPDIPIDSCVQIRKLGDNEELQEGGYYYIEFEGRKAFRMVVDDEINGIGFLPMTLKERRIAYDLDYVNIIGKAVSMRILFDN